MKDSLRVKKNKNCRTGFGIAGRLTVHITACLLLFVLIMGTAFSLLLYSSSRQSYVNSLRSTAATIGEMVAASVQKRGVIVIGENGGEPYNSSQPGEGGPLRPDGEFRVSTAALARFISGITNATVWLIAPDQSGESYNMMFMMKDERYTDTAFASLNSRQQDFVRILFTGDYAIAEFFGNLFGEHTITVGMPIVNREGNAIGAVVMHGSASVIYDSFRSGLITMGFSMIAALIVGFIAAMLLSRKFTRPLLRINETAIRISEGDYGARTDVSGNDEIGVLARTMDEMGEKLEAANEESEKLQRVRQDFIGNISHELRTPVTVIRGSLEALCDGVVKEPELVGRYHAEMLKESKYMQRLVNDLLDLSRLQNPDFSMNIREFNLYDCVSDVVRSTRRIAAEKGVEVGFEYDANDLPFRGDYDRIRQMLLIVTDNAVKFTDAGSPGVAVKMSEGEITVTNTGRGINAEELPHIFERFYRSRSETNKNGTGLGLPIARQIALRHGVGISVKSVPGGETTFVFDFAGGGVSI